MDDINFIDEVLNGRKLPAGLSRSMADLRKKKLPDPITDNPMLELKRLVRQHKSIVKSAVAVHNMTTDKKAQQDIIRDDVVVYKKGETIPCRLPIEDQARGAFFVKAYQKSASRLEPEMLRELKKIPIYRDYLGKVFVARGPLMSGYLVSEIDIYKAVKPSNLRRFCGFAVIDGGLERPKKGVKNAYSSEMRTRIYQIFDGLQKNRRHSPDNKYLSIWDGYKSRIEHSERLIERGVDKKGVWTGKLENNRGKLVSARGFANNYGWHKAADVFLEDLYTVWRAMEGLPVWPSYYAAKLGYSHGGTISVNHPSVITVEEAFALVGDKGYSSVDVKVDDTDIVAMTDLDVAAE